MSDQLWAVLIAAVLGPSLLFLLGRVFGGWRKDSVESDAAVAVQWQAWSTEQGKRIDKLEARVADLETTLASERDKNRRQSDLMRSLVRWAILLRDEVIRLGGDLPPAPIEVEAALTNLDP